MNTTVTRYIQRQLFVAEESMRIKAADTTGKTFPERTMTVLLQKDARDFLAKRPNATRWIIIPGLRGVGKTTLVAQTYLWLARQAARRVNLLYISLDEVVERLGSNLDEVLEEYQNVIGATLETVNKPTFLFIDEVQADPRWARSLKFLFDRTSNVFILCTGSSATHIQVDADVGGRRAVIEKLYPLSFPEYQVLSSNTFPARGIKSSLIDTLYNSDNAEKAYDKLKKLEPTVVRQWAKYDRKSISRYLTVGTMPFTLSEPDPRQVYQALSGMVDKIVTLDLQTLQHFNSDSLAAMKRIIFVLAECDDVVTLETLVKVGGVSKPQVLNILDALTKAELLIKVPAHGNNFTSTRQPSKYFFMSPAIRASFHDIVGNPETEQQRRGMLLEDAAVLHFYREFISKRTGSLSHYYEKAGGHCDFILKVGNHHQIAIELGLGKKGTIQVEQTMNKVKCSYGLVFSDDPLRLYKDKNIVSVPLDYLFLM